MDKPTQHSVRLLAGFVLAIAFALAAAPGAHASCAAPGNEVEAENCLPGTSQAQWDVNGAGDASIQGFATDISVPQGGRVDFKVDTTAASYRLDIYRMGYYGGAGARFVTTVTPTAVRNEDACPQDGDTGLIDCSGWAVSASWNVPADAVSGIYFAKLVAASGASSHVVFVVRDDDGASDLLFQTSDTTWQAYNPYGGNSLYVGNPVGRAYKVSYNRPFTTRGSSPEDWVFNAEYPMVRWLERNGYDVSYTTGVDADRAGAELREHRAFLSVGHDEYWSGTQRANVEAARNAGVSLAFFSGNEVFWKTRWENNHRTLVTYKETHANEKIDPEPNTWTGTWRDPRPFNPQGGQPENALTGTIFTVNAGSAALQVPADDGKLRLWRGTPVAQQFSGGVATLTDGSVGYEWDEDLDNGARPAGLIRLSSTTVSGVDKLQDYGSTYATGTATHHLTLYRDANGASPDALVFGGGTVQWSWGLDSNHDRGSQATDPSMQQATVNLFADMAVQPRTLQSGLTAASASTDAAPPTPTIASPVAGGTVELRSPVTIEGTAVDAGGRVGAVEVSVDNGVSWHPATGRETWSYAWTPTAPGPATIRVRAADDSGNLSSGATAVGVTVTGRSCPCSMFGSLTPADTTANDGVPIEVGVKFRSDEAGTITALRYYKGAGWTGTRTGHLWSASGGAPLATVQFTGESASGWQQAPLSQPVADRREHDLRRLLLLEQRLVRVEPRLLHRDPRCRAAARADRRQRRLHVRTNGGFPVTSARDSNYWADVVFAPDDATPPAVSSVAPADGSANVPAGTQVSATFDEPLRASSVTTATVRLRTAAGDVVPASVAYAAGSRTATLTPAAPLVAGGLYTATVAGVEDAAGNPLPQPVSWSFTVTPATPGPGPGPTPGSEPNDKPVDTPSTGGAVAPRAPGPRAASRTARPRASRWDGPRRCRGAA